MLMAARGLGLHEVQRLPAHEALASAYALRVADRQAMERAADDRLALASLIAVAHHAPRDLSQIQQDREFQRMVRSQPRAAAPSAALQSLWAAIEAGGVA